MVLEEVYTKILTILINFYIDDSFEEAVDRMRDQIIDVFGDTSLSVYVTGPAGIIIDAVKVFQIYTS